MPRIIFIFAGFAEVSTWESFYQKYLETKKWEFWCWGLMLLEKLVSSLEKCMSYNALNNERLIFSLIF